MILRASALMAGSSLIVAIAAAIRYKLVAIEYGTEGVGLLGLLTVISTLLVIAGGLGLGSSGVRSVAQVRSDPAQLRKNSDALLFGSGILSLVAGAVTFLTVDLIDFSGPDSTSLVLEVSIATTVSAGICYAAQSALLNGLGSIRLLALSAATGSLLATGLTLLVVMSTSDNVDAIVGVALASGPVASTLIAGACLIPHRLEIRRSPRSSGRAMRSVLRVMVRLGVAVAFALLIGAGTQYVGRFFVNNELGLAGVGLYQGAVAIGSVYLTFVLGGLAVEYFPRISELTHDPAAINHAIDEQIAIAVRLAAPLILLLIVTAPLALRLLFSTEFEPADSLLRILLVSDILKIPGWAIGFAFLAFGERNFFLASEVVFNVIFVAFVAAFVEPLGVTAVGLASLFAYAAYLVVAAFLIARRTGYRASRPVTTLVLVTTGFSVLVTAVVWTDSTVGTLVAALLASAYSAHAAASLRRDYRGSQRNAAV